MSEANQQPYRYTRGDLERYLSGKMSPAEMHRLEKAALDDPFLADALEGMLDFSGPGLSRDMQDLERRLAGKLENQPLPDEGKQPAKTPDITGMPGDATDTGADQATGAGRFRIPPATGSRYRPYRIAASIALLIGLGLVTTWIINRRTDTAPALAVNEERSRITDSVPAGDAGRSTSRAADSAVAMASMPATDKPAGTGGPAGAKTPAGQPLAENEVAGVEKPVTNEAARDMAAAGELTSAEAQREAAGKSETQKATARKEMAAAPAGKPEADRTQGVAAAPAPKDNRQQEVMSVPPNKARMKTLQPGATENAAGPYVFTGQVRDPQGTPLSFVNIRIRNSAASTYSDARGHYRIVSADSSLVIDLNAVGYQGRTLVLSAAHPEQQVLMQAGGKAAPAKISQPKASSKEEMTRVDEADNAEPGKPEAEPTDGWSAYQYYLLNNIRIPRDAAQQKLHGTVELSFQVADNGRLSDFRVEKSLSPSCDKEAIRLLKEGPGWTLYNSDKPLRTKVTIVF